MAEKERRGLDRVAFDNGRMVKMRRKGDTTLFDALVEDVSPRGVQLLIPQTCKVGDVFELVGSARSIPVTVVWQRLHSTHSEVTNCAATAIEQDVNLVDALAQGFDSTEHSNLNTSGFS